jgi:hypothetical protein
MFDFRKYNIVDTLNWEASSTYLDFFSKENEAIFRTYMNDTIIHCLNTDMFPWNNFEGIIIRYNY